MNNPESETTKAQEARGLEPIEEPAEELIEELVEELVKVPAEDPIQEPIEEPVAEPIKIYTVPKPKKVAQIICPFCEEQRNIKGINRHIVLKHNVPDVSVQDLHDVKEGSKTLEELVCEKFDDDVAEITNVLDKVLKKDFPTWKDTEPEEKEDPEGPDQEEDLGEGLEGPEEEEDPEEGETSKLPAIAFIIAIVGIATIFLRRIDPRFKEITDELINKLEALGSNKSSFRNFPPPGF